MYRPQFHRFISEFFRQWSEFFAEKIFREMFFARTFFLRIAEKTAKIAHGITLKSCCQAIVREFKIGHYGQPVRLDEYWDLGRVVMRMISSPSFTVAVLRR